jgi:hypothetical protein
MAAGFPQASDPKQQGRSCNVFHDLVLAVTLCHFCNILLVISVVGGNSLRAGKSEGDDHWGQSGKLATSHKCVDSFFLNHPALFTLPTMLRRWQGGLCLVQFSSTYYALTALESGNKGLPTTIVAQTIRKSNSLSLESTLVITNMHFPEYMSREELY